MRTKSLAIYYSDSSTNSLVIAKPKKFPYLIECSAAFQWHARTHTHAGGTETETKLMHFIWFISSLMLIFVAKRESQNSGRRPANTYKLIRKLVPRKRKPEGCCCVLCTYATRAFIIKYDLRSLPPPLCYSVDFHSAVCIASSPMGASCARVDIGSESSVKLTHASE